MQNAYTPLAKLLHWWMALMIFGLLGLGFFMTSLPLSPQKLQYYSWHKWAGISVFLLVWVRLAWRLLNPPPAYPETMSPRLKRMASAGHHMLYLLMIAIPLSGWLMSSAKGIQTVWFGIWPIPDLLSKDKELGDMLALLHGSLNWLLIVMLLGHVGAALKHHWIDGDDILLRMLPRGRTAQTS